MAGVIAVGGGGFGAGLAAWPGQGHDVGEQLRRTMQVGRGATIAGGLGRGAGFGARSKDALDGAVTGVANLDRPGARPLESRRSVFVGQVKHALGGAQPKQALSCSKSAMTVTQAGPISAALVRHQVGCAS